MKYTHILLHLLFAFISFIHLIKTKYFQFYNNNNDDERKKKQREERIFQKNKKKSQSLRKSLNV